MYLVDDFGPDKLNFGLFGYFVPGGSPTCFDLGRGPITLPGPAMVRMGRRDLNSDKTKQNRINWGIGDCV